MADLEKVIKGLECCTTIGEDGFPICDECPYFCDESCPNLDEMHMDALELLKAQPTVDAVPVVNGHWIKRHNWVPISQTATKNFPFYECSRCRWIRRLVNEYDYCPNCGAKMDLDEPPKEGDGE